MERPEVSGPGLDLDALLRRWRLIVALILLGGLTGTLLMQQREVKQIATASIIVRVPGSATLFGTLSGDQPEPARHVADQAAILASPTIAAGAIQRLDRAVPGHGYRVNTFIRQTRVTPRVDSDIIEIRFEDPDRRTAIAAVEGMIASYEEASTERESSFSAALAEVDTSIEATTATIETLQTQITALAESDDAADAAELALLTDRRDQAVQRESTLLARRDQLTVDAALEASTFDLVSAPTAGDADGRGWILGALAGVVLGGSIGITAAYWLDNGRPTIRDARRLEAVVGAPTLVELPSFDTELPMTDPDSPAADGIWRLSRMLEPVAHDGVAAPTVVAFVSPHADAHRTLVAVNTAIALSMTERPVALVSTETRDSALRSLLDRHGARPATTDLIEVIRDPGRARWATQPAPLAAAPLLDVLTCRPAPRSPRDLFASPRFHEVIDRLTEHYAAVVLDVPALLDEDYGVDVVRQAIRTVAVMASPISVRDGRDLRRVLDIHSLSLDGCVVVTPGPVVTDAAGLDAPGGPDPGDALTWGRRAATDLPSARTTVQT